MNFSERSSRQLYIPRNIDDSPNQEVFDVINSITLALGGEPEFIGVDPFGSTMKGYSDTDSDIDIQLLLDFNCGDIEDLILRAGEINQRGSELERKALNALDTFSGKKRKVHITIFHVSLVENLERIKYGLRLDETDPLVIGNLFRRVSGDRINKYRDSVVQEIKKLAPTEQVDVVQRIASALVERELLNWHKVAERSTQELNRLLVKERRIQMWVERITTFLV